MKIGIIQQAYLGSKKLSQAYSSKEIKELAKKGAELIVLGELHQSEYFCQSFDVKYFDYAKDIKADIAYWSAVAKQNQVVLVSSLFEKRSEGLYHNTAYVFEKDGKLAGKYRKMHIPDDPSFYEKFYFTPGDLGFNPINTSLGKLGVLICWDQWYPEAARLMALKGANILIYPTAIGWLKNESKKEQARQLDAWISIQKAHSIANNLPLISVNRCGLEGENLVFWGNSLAFDAGGELLFKADGDPISFILDINMKKCEELRRWWPFLRDRRVEYYKDIAKLFID